MACIRSFKYSASEARYSVSSTTLSQSSRMLLRSSSVISVPMDVSAACFTSAATSSGMPRVEKSVLLALDFKPIYFTTFAYARFSVMILPTSGKCHPYHSRSLIAKLFSSLSRSSSSPTAWMIMVSTLSGENFSLKRESVWANPNAMLLISSSPRPSMSVVRCILTPRMISLTLSLITEISIPSFLVMFWPKTLSSTASFSPRPGSTMCFFRSFFSPLPTFPSVSSVAASMAAFVSANLWNPFRPTWR
mmetsp:Transcript_47695/g.103748  ORF Transcript_47695/g.103748 Transcript_47695/m.103748 type:complete len:248 (+) Transcript_47695:780-1523(+)